MKRPAHFTLVDADKIGAVFTQRTEWRKRAEKAESRIEVLEKRDTELRIQMLAARAEMVSDESRVAKVFAGVISVWAAALAAKEKKP